MEWGPEFMKTMRVVGDGRIIHLIWAGDEETELIDKFLKDEIEIKKEQGIQVDWGKTDRSTLNQLYKEIKKGLEGEKYWEKK